MKYYDVMIVGAGPAGSALAIQLAGSGYKVALLERSRFPRDKICGDLVSARGLDLLRDLGCDPSALHRSFTPIRAAHVYFDGRRLSDGPMPRLPGLPPHGHAIPRIELDEMIFRRAQQAGAETFEDCAVRGFETTAEGVTIDAVRAGRATKFRGRVIIGADGAQSIVAKTAGLDMRDPRYVLPAMRAYCHGLSLPHAVLCFEEAFFPGYAWIFPVADGLVNIGVGMVQQTMLRHRIVLREFYRRIEEFIRRLAAAQGASVMIDKPHGWPIKSYVAERTNAFERGLLIGEAACFVDPMTGEGIPLALESARIAHTTIDQAFNCGRFDRATLVAFDRRWRAAHDVDLRLSDLVVSIARNRHTRDFSMHALKVMALTAQDDRGFALTIGGIMAGLIPARAGLAPERVAAPLLHGPEFWRRAFDVPPRPGIGDLLGAARRIGRWNSRLARGLIAEPRWHRDWLLELQRKCLDIAVGLTPRLPESGAAPDAPAERPATPPRSQRRSGSMRSAVVIGATGHLGSAIVRELLNHGWSVTAASRRSTLPINLAHLPIRFARLAQRPEDSFAELVAGHELVVDAGAPYPVNRFAASDSAERYPREYASQRTHALLAAVRQHACRLAYVGSFTTLNRRRDPLQRLQAGVIRRLHPYFEVKRQTEDALLAEARRGVPIALVNPTVCIGPWDIKRREQCLIPQLLSAELAAFIEHELNVIDVRDVAAALRAAVDAEHFGEAIALAGHNVTTGSLATRICQIGQASVPAPRLRLPPRGTLALALAAEATLGLARRASPSPSLATMLVNECYWTAPGTAQRGLGVWPRPLSVTLADAIDWYRRLGYC